MALTPSQKIKRNYNYGILSATGNLEYAPYYLVIGKKVYINANAEKYLSEGWKYIVNSEAPVLDDTSNYYLKTVYTEDETTIFVGYEVERIISEDEIPEE